MSKSYRPNLIRPDYGSPYYELSGVSTPGGVLRGDGLVKYVLRDFDVLVGMTLTQTLAIVKTELDSILAKTTWPEARGVVFYFDILETGTTTFGELYVDLEDQTTRQVLYNLRSREVKESKFTSTTELFEKLQWMVQGIRTNGQTDLVEVNLVTYKRFDDNYDV